MKSVSAFDFIRTLGQGRILWYALIYGGGCAENKFNRVERGESMVKSEPSV